MIPWPSRPRIYEINTRVWLDELSRQAGRRLTLGELPGVVWDGIAARGFDAVWLMGVWERSPIGIAIANQSPDLLADFQRALPDYRPEDNVGSPYCIRRYVADAHLGGPEGLAAARMELARRGLRLLIDFVPNHVAPDHPWVSEHPEYFIQGVDADLARDPNAFYNAGHAIIARGRDPNSPAWPDVLQINAFHPGLRQAVIATLTDIASQCDGVRCDMAMLMMNEVFARTWGGRAGFIPAVDFWPLVIPALHRRHPGFLFIAEVYWDLEWALQQQGFDSCYDKRLYDRLEREEAAAVRQHLGAGLDYQEKLVRFLENHDEPRAAAAFPPAKHRAAAIAAYTLPGAKLFHEGQLDGRKTKVPVFLGRRPAESPDPELRSFYAELLALLGQPALRDGDWRLCELTGWPDNASYRNLVAWVAQIERPVQRYMIVVNLAESPAQGRVRLPWSDLVGRTWQLEDVFGRQSYERDGGEMVDPGLYVELPAWGFHCLRFADSGAPVVSRYHALD